MPVNQALVSCVRDVAAHKYLRGNVLVLRHRQSSLERYENLPTKDVALVAAVLCRCAKSVCVKVSYDEW